MAVADGCNKQRSNQWMTWMLKLWKHLTTAFAGLAILNKLNVV